MIITFEAMKKGTGAYFLHAYTIYLRKPWLLSFEEYMKY